MGVSTMGTITPEPPHGPNHSLLMTISRELLQLCSRYVGIFFLGGGGGGGGGGELHKCPSTCIFWFKLKLQLSTFFFCLLGFSESTNAVKIEEA